MMDEERAHFEEWKKYETIACCGVVDEHHDSGLPPDLILLPSITCRFPNKVGGYKANNHESDEEGIKNPVWHSPRKLPKRNQSTNSSG